MTIEPMLARAMACTRAAMVFEAELKRTPWWRMRSRLRLAGSIAGMRGAAADCLEAAVIADGYSGSHKVNPATARPPRSPCAIQRPSDRTPPRPRRPIPSRRTL